MNNYVLIAIAIFLITVIAVCIGVSCYLKRKQKTAGEFDLSSKKDVKNHLYLLYRIYMVTPIVRRYFLKVKNRYRVILPADEVTLNKKTTQRMTLCLSVCLAIFTGICLTCRGDLPYVLVGLLACYIIFTNMINSSESAMQLKLLDQMDTFTTDLHAYYHDTEMVDEAISACLDELPYEIGLHANKLYNIVTSTDVEAELEKYMETAPNRFLLLLAAICSSVKEYGDKKIEDGKSIFLKNLNYLKEELNEERNRLRSKQIAFTGKVFGVFIPLFILKPAEYILTVSMPDLKNFYSGAAGAVSLAVIVVTTFICYELINTLKDDHSEEGKDNRILKMISELPFVKYFLKLKIEHNYSKSLRVADGLKEVGDTGGINVFYVKRYLLAALLAVVVNVVSFMALGRAGALIINDFSESYSDALVPNEEYREQMRDTSLRLNGYIKKPDVAYEEILQYASSDLDPQMAELVATELMGRAEDYKQNYYRYYMLLLSIVAAVIGYFIPVWLLKYKQKIRGMNREDEVAQFRTLILILMHEDGMTLDTVLEWMERFAHSFKPSISECILNLESSQQDAIITMRETESGFAPFRRLCDGLLAVDKVGLEGAFDDLEIERDYYQEKRKIDNEELLKKCSLTAGYIMMIPILAITIIYLFLPFGSLVLNMLMDFGTIT